LPWLGLLLASCAVVWLLVRVNQSRIRPGHVLRLHRDQRGSVETLSFVLTLPIFVWVMMFIVQVSQLMIGSIVVHYAAFAAARAAIVWTPVRVENDFENCIGMYALDPSAPDQVFPDLPLVPVSEGGFVYEIIGGGLTYVVPMNPASAKHQKIATAAILACMPISPSARYDLALNLDPRQEQILNILTRAYESQVPSSRQNAKTAVRLRNKLTYAIAATSVRMRFYHPNGEPPLFTYDWLRLPVRSTDPTDFVESYVSNGLEIGWQDPIEVTVTHDFALLPGAGRLLARFVAQPDDSGTDEVAARIRKVSGNVYVYRLLATATLSNEGEKPVIPYVYTVY
jgi:hypothetical protein